MSQEDVTDVYESKRFEKLAKEIGDEAAREFVKRSSEELNKVIVTCETQMAEAQEQMLENEEYQKAKNKLDEFRRAKREHDKPLKLKKDMAIYLVNTRKAFNKGEQ